jgi:hypothetical protein
MSLRFLTFRSIRLVLVMGLAGLLQAGVIYDNGGPNTDNGYSIKDGASVADDFTLTNSSAIAAVGFYFQNYNGITGWNQDVIYAFRADNGGSPGNVLATGAGANLVAVDSGLPWCCGGGNAYLVTFDLQAPLLATSGVRYWLELTGATGSAGSAWWVTADANSTLNGLIRNGPQGQWNDYGAHFAFYLMDDGQGPLPGGEIPEPGTSLLLGLGLAAVAAFRLRR